jgi:signal transduction histidine kinase
VREIALAHGGGVSAHSGGGRTAFVITLPRRSVSA